MTGGQPGQEIARVLPFLRRYARAVTGDQARGDRDVAAALTGLADRLAEERLHDPRLALFRALHDTWNGSRLPAAVAEEPSDSDLLEGTLALETRLHELAPPFRQALLLATLEEFDRSEVAQIMAVGEAEVDALLDEAKAELRRQPPSRVLVVEDEPVIALDIATSLEGNGHTVVGIATTHRQAVALSRQHRPDLILADIRLADESSGLEAVHEILREAELPVVFVTAYPERLLTGTRPEPTFLVTKPFDADTLDITISQALASARRRRREQPA
jgi:CheY-like chemotaxis protein/DNA-directed RNA polymerase specialized sigma24 family protein